MQLKQFYNIASKVSSRKSATSFGDLPDCIIFLNFALDGPVENKSTAIQVINIIKQSCNPSTNSPWYITA